MNVPDVKRVLYQLPESCTGMLLDQYGEYNVGLIQLEVSQLFMTHRASCILS